MSKMITPEQALDNLIANFNHMISATEGLNANKSDNPLRSRELSLAVTHMEEAEHWMEHLRARLTPTSPLEIN